MDWFLYDSGLRHEKIKFYKDNLMATIRVPECITKLAWNVKIKSVHELEMLKICWFIYLAQTKLRSYNVDLRPSKVVISFWYLPCIVALKSHNTIIRNRLLLTICSRSSRAEVFCKKDVLRNFAKFTVKHQCQRLFLIKLGGFFTELLRWVLLVFQVEF